MKAALPASVGSAVFVVQTIAVEKIAVEKIVVFEEKLMNSTQSLSSFFSVTLLLLMCSTGAARAAVPIVWFTAITDTAANEALQAAAVNASVAGKNTASKAPVNPFGSRPVSGATLSAKRGGASVFSDAELKGVVSNNVASHLTTGMNVISEGAFSGSSGLPLVVQNSGNNVLIQNSTIVNVQLK